MASGEKLLKVLFNLKAEGNGIYIGQRLWRTNPLTIYGGELAAQAVLAAYNSVDNRFKLHSFYTHFIKKTDLMSPTRYHVELLNEGATFRSVLVRTLQNDLLCSLMTASFKVEEPSSLVHEQSLSDHSVLQSVPRPNELATGLELLTAATKNPSLTSTQLKHVNLAISSSKTFPCEIKPCDPFYTLKLMDAPEPRLRMWMRIRDCPKDIEPPHKVACLAYMPDSFILCSTFLTNHRYKLGFITSLDYSFWFHDVRNYHPSNWVLFEAATQRAGNALTLNFGRIYLEDGSHIATLSQQGFFREKEPLKQRSSG
jgi:acyl-CoA thioesterase II